jgi:phosphonate degradation associated HDIG domain protein
MASLTPQFSDTNSQTIVATIRDLFEKRGSSMYSGEPVTQTEHALQAAWAAEQENASDSLIAAALLHDVGHLLHDMGEDCADDGVDDRHEALGALWLARHFGPDVVEPVRLHVPAKRYLCAVDAAYRARLSPASVLSLQLQGGPYSPEEVELFRAHPHFKASLRLRGWDETAKVRGLVTPPLGHFLDSVERVLAQSQLRAEFRSSSP